MNLNTFVTMTDNIINGFQCIRINEGEFAGIEYVYGSVGVEENAERTEAKLSFDFMIVDGLLMPENEIAFKQLTGEILQAILDDQLDSSSVVYSGGLDE